VRTKLGAALAATALAVGATVIMANPAGADPGGFLCMTRDATPVYATYSNGVFSDYLYTTDGGRGFRMHAASYDNEHYVWFYGHGADRPDRDGYVRGEHLAC